MRAGFAIAIVSALVGVLMLVRLSMTGRAYQRRAVREHAARIASQALVSATSADQVVAAARAALRRVITGPGPVEVQLVPSGGPDVGGTITGPGDVGRRAVSLAGLDCALLFTAPRSELHELSDLLASLTDQAALALARIDLIAAAGREERERYFRTLVLTSTDVILISRAGTIEYATPSGRPCSATTSSGMTSTSSSGHRRRGGDVAGRSARGDRGDRPAARRHGGLGTRAAARPHPRPDGGRGGHDPA